MSPTDKQMKVYLGLFGRAPYRYFCSGTQFRNDGSDLLLQGITGPVVFSYPLQQGVDEGFLARPNFRMVKVPTDVPRACSDDALEMIDAHYYRNKSLHKTVATLANQAVRLLGHQVLILVEHIEQFQHLLPYFGYEARFAHGGVTKKNRDFLDSRFWKSNPRELVKNFNANEFPILVGTGCVGTGTDFQGVQSIFYLQAGKSRIKLSQAIGRGTRKPEGKSEFWFWDFDVDCRSDAIKYMTEARANLYRSLYPGAYQEF